MAGINTVKQRMISSKDKLYKHEGYPKNSLFRDKDDRSEHF